VQQQSTKQQKGCKIAAVPRRSTEAAQTPVADFAERDIRLQHFVSSDNAIIRKSSTCREEAPATATTPSPETGGTIPTYEHRASDNTGGAWW
jgi:hypothetical protein